MLYTYLPTGRRQEKSTQTHLCFKLARHLVGLHMCFIYRCTVQYGNTSKDLDIDLDSCVKGHARYK